MSDIHQEWADLRKKNGEFICHLDGEMAKLKKHEQKKGIENFITGSLLEVRPLVAPPPLSCCCPDNSDILEALYKAQAESDRLAETVSKMEKTIRDLRDALDQSAKDAEANFNRGRIKGMEEIWDELRDVYSGRTTGENQKIFGYGTTGEIIKNLSPTWFINRVEEYHEEEKKIKIGDEIMVIGLLGSDDSGGGIVYDINEEPDGSKCYHVIGPCNCVAFGDNAIAEGSIRKTGKHYDNIPFDYIA